MDVLVVGRGPGRGRRRHRGPPASGSTRSSSTRPASPATRPAATASPPARCACSTSSGFDVPRRCRRTRRSPTPCWCRPPAARSWSRSPATARTPAWCRALELDAALVDLAARARRRRPRARRRSPRSRSTGTPSRRRSPTAPIVRPRVDRSPPTATTPPCAGCSRRSRPPSSERWQAFRQYFSGVDDRRLWVLFEEDFLPGYAWVFPVGDGRANLGFGVLRDGERRRAERQGARRAVAVARRSPERAPGPRSERATGRHGAAPGPSPRDYDRARLAHGRALFVGDAANVVDPMTGEGIAQAIETGTLAARAIAASPRRHRRRRRPLPRRRRPRAGRRPPLRGAAAAHPARTRSAHAPRIAAAALTPWTRRNFARWMFEDYPRAARADAAPLAPGDVRVRRGLLPTLVGWP